MTLTTHTHDITHDLITIRDYLRYGTSLFHEAHLHFGHGTDNAWDEALALLTHALHLPADMPSDLGECRLTQAERKKVLEWFQMRIQTRQPVPYLTGKALFAGLEFNVDPRVLIPRSPIAELIENQFQPWIDVDRVENILDLCTGSACIAIACAHYFPYAHVVGADISEPALEVAKMNVAKHSLENSVELCRSDVFDGVAEQKFDIIVSNPPYVDAEDMAALPAEYRHEPQLALTAGEDGLAIVTRILEQAPNYLTDHGILVVEVGNSAAALEEAFPELPFQWLEFERGEAEVFLLRREDLISH